MEALNVLFLQTLFNGPADLESVVLRLLLAFVLGQFMAWVYSWTHGGLSYSRSFVQSIVVLPVIVALIMIVIANSIVTAFGLLGALALIRFRNVLKDTRDTVFIFGSLVVGMGVGCERYGVATLGCIALSLIMLYLKWSGFGGKGFHDGFLRFCLEESPGDGSRLNDILHRHCSSMTLVSVRRGGGEEPAEYAYQISLRDRQRNAELLDDLQAVDGMSDLSLSLHEELQEA